MAEVKVKLLADKLPSVLSSPVKVTVTSLLGALVNTAVKVAVVPVSDVVNGLPVSVKPAVSLSELVTVTVPVLALAPEYKLSLELVVAVRV